MQERVSRDDESRDQAAYFLNIRTGIRSDTTGAYASVQKSKTRKCEAKCTEVHIVALARWLPDRFCSDLA
jgi:hypothetical protein